MELAPKFESYSVNASNKHQMMQVSFVVPPNQKYQTQTSLNTNDPGSWVNVGAPIVAGASPQPCLFSLDLTSGMAVKMTQIV